MLGSNLIRVVSSLIAAVCRGFSGVVRRLLLLSVVAPVFGFGSVVPEVNTSVAVLSRGALQSVLWVALLARLKKWLERHPSGV